MSRTQSVPTLSSLPRSFPEDGAISIELDGGVPILRASSVTQERIEGLLEKQRTSSITDDEEKELQQYEEIDDYLSYLNRLSRNLNAAAQLEDNRVA